MPRFPTRARFLSLLFALSGAVLAGCSPAEGAENAPAVGAEAKDFELIALGGETVKLSKQTDAGPVVLVVLRGYPGYHAHSAPVKLASSSARRTRSKRPARRCCSSTPARPTN